MTLRAIRKARHPDRRRSQSVITGFTVTAPSVTCERIAAPSRFDKLAAALATFAGYSTILALPPSQSPPVSNRPTARALVRAFRQ
jgi:hypothetical protein